MSYDDMLHCIFHGFNRGLRWWSMKNFGADNDDYEWYYAENRLYVIRDKAYRTYYFVEASCPKEAYKKMLEQFNSVVNMEEVEN